METPLSHLARLEITTADVEASARLHEQKFGMRIIDRVGGNVDPAAAKAAGLVAVSDAAEADVAIIRLMDPQAVRT